jgi:nicotinamide mononucleotide transporter
VDVVFIYVCCSRGLYLTAGLYLLFIVMCVAGLREWRKALRQPVAVKQEAEVVEV